MPNLSPVRYPGGKSRLSLLFSYTVEYIVLNDYDVAIYSFWWAVIEESEALIDQIRNTPVTIAEWYRQKEIYDAGGGYSLDLAFATLFLNRTNCSGILNAGPIGGRDQSGKWTLDVRFNREALIARI